MKSVIIFLLFLPFTSAFASYSTLEIDNYTTIQKIIEEKASQYNPGELLVVFDIDHTLLMTDDCLKETNTLNGFKRFERSVWKCGGFLTSPIVPDIIQSLQDEDFEVMALTARRGFLHKPTLLQLQKRMRVYKNSDSDSSELHFTTAPGYDSTVIDIDFTQPGKKKTLNKTLTYSEGVAFVSGANKGLALQAFNQNFGKSYKEIIFVDDSLTNIENLECAYNNAENHITIIHYLEYAKAKKEKNPCGLRD